jgi:hypothetical protein
MTLSKRLAGVPPVPSFAGRNGSNGSIHVGTGNGDRRGDKEPLAAGSLHNFKASVALAGPSIGLRRLAAGNL